MSLSGNAKQREALVADIIEHAPPMATAGLVWDKSLVEGRLHRALVAFNKKTKAGETAEEAAGVEPVEPVD